MPDDSAIMKKERRSPEGSRRRSRRHDRGYRLLFSHPRMVEDLITSFVKPEFLPEIDFSTLTPCKGSYVTESFRGRETDVLWKVEVKKRPVYFYILIEFQSKVDRFMALRMLLYILLFYQDLIRQEKLKHLPSVFPLVIYNGKRTWKAARSLEKLITIPFRGFEAYVPRFSFLTIEENRFSKEGLLARESILARIFLLETAPLSEIEEVVEDFLALYRKELNQELRRLLAVWLGHKLRDLGFEGESIDFDEGEVTSMFEANVKAYRKQLKEEGKAEGESIGEARGEARGELKEKHAMAKRMYKERMAPEIIQKLTGLSGEEIAKLCND